MGKNGSPASPANGGVNLEPDGAAGVRLPAGETGNLPARPEASGRAGPTAGGKDSYRIGEVAALTQLEPYVLRYWETEFAVLHPAKTPHGQRLYRRADVETILTIKRLLYEQGFTIAGARKQLEAVNGSPSLAVDGAAPPGAGARKSNKTREEQLRAVRTELEALLTRLSRR